MSTNHHTPWQDTVTEYKAADMNAPLGELDAAIEGVSGELQTQIGEITTLSGELATHYTQYLALSGEVAGLDVTTLSGELASHINDYVALSGEYATHYTQYLALSGEVASIDYTSLSGEVAALSGEVYTMSGELASHLTDYVATSGEVAALMSGEAGGGQPYDIGITYNSTTTSGEYLLNYPFPRAVTYGTDMQGSWAIANVAPTGQTTFYMQKDGVNFGTIIFAAGIPSGEFSGETTFSAGNVFRITTPGTPDATLAEMGLSIAGTRS